MKRNNQEDKIICEELKDFILSFQYEENNPKKLEEREET